MTQNNIFKLLDDDNNNILHLFVTDNNTRKIKKVLKELKNYNGKIAFINHMNNEGNTPLHLAVENKNNSIINLLLKNGANSEIINANGQKINTSKIQSGGGKQYIYHGTRYL